MVPKHKCIHIENTNSYNEQSMNCFYNHFWEVIIVMIFYSRHIGSKLLVVCTCFRLVAIVVDTTTDIVIVKIFLSIAILQQLNDTRCRW